MARKMTEDKIIAKMEEIMDSRLQLLNTEYLNVQDLARDVGLSTTHLYSMWEKHKGKRWANTLPVEVTVRERRKLWNYSLEKRGFDPQN